MLNRRKSTVPPPESLCPLKTCLHILGGAWTPNIVWYLKAEPRRFSELKDDVGEISAKVLTEKLRRLVDEGIVERRVVPTSPPTVEYSLTELGHELRPALEAIVKVGLKIRERVAAKAH
jgi:DNA-binding HxlR family transcriptional regulator